LPNVNEDRVLDVAITEPATLDPMLIQDPGSVLIARQLYEGLVSWDAGAREVVPAAAGSWEISKGGTRFVFHLEAGMTFHDGSEVGADDFAFAFDRLAKKENASALAYTLEPVKGFDEVNQLGDAERLAGISTPDPLTLQIDLQRPYYDFLKVLTHPGLVPLPREMVEDQAGFIRQPIGNGPFQIAGPWSPGDPLLLVRFEGFLRTAALDGIRFTPFPDAAASWLPFVGEEFDVAEVPAGQVEAAAARFGDSGSLPFLASYNFGLNLGSGPLRNEELRRAVSMAIDRKRIAEGVYKGTLEPARGIVPSAMPGFSTDRCGELCEYRPDEAAAIVAGLPAGERSLTLDYTVGSPHERVARIVERNLVDVGLDVKVKGYPFDEFIRRLRKGEQQIYRLGWIAEYPTPDVYLDPLFRSDSPDNNSGFDSKAVDELLRKARAEPSEGKRRGLYRRAEAKILEAVPIVPIGSFVTHWAVHDYVDHLSFDEMGGFEAVAVRLDR
jgi:peptide/nickel transport system substrate-binding protein/oligopeptide transport system substrate-binding protein